MISPLNMVIRVKTPSILSLNWRIFLQNRISRSTLSPPLIPIRCQKHETMDCRDNSMATDRVVCPKPRRVGPSRFNSITSMRIHSRDDDTASDSKTGTELLDLILRKENYEIELCTAGLSSPQFPFGSPPYRAPNPLVQDAHFRVNLPTTMVSSPSDSPSQPPRVKFGNKQAVVRVEGFDCQGSRFASTTYNS